MMTMNSSLIFKNFLIPSIIFSRYTCIANMASSSSPSSFPDCKSDYLVGFITIGKHDDAKQLARKLVNENLVACCNIVPKVTSIYRWENKLEEDGESLMIIKTHKNRSEDLIKFVKSNHPYSVPEIIFMPIIAGSADYLKWLFGSVNKE